MSIASQCIGALLAALVLRMIWPEQTGLVAPMLGAFLAHPCCRCVQGKVCCELRNDLKENEG